MSKRVIIDLDNDTEADQIYAMFRASLGNTDPARGALSIIRVQIEASFTPMHMTGGYRLVPMGVYR